MAVTMMMVMMIITASKEKDKDDDDSNDNEQGELVDGKEEQMSTPKELPCYSSQLN